jgi:DNA mismatch endonuclease (patch repair protein)
MKPEMAVRKMLHTAGFRFRLHVKDLPGKPDIVLPKWQTALLAHCCFRHRRQSNCPNKTCKVFSNTLQTKLI